MAISPVAPLAYTELEPPSLENPLVCMTVTALPSLVFLIVYSAEKKFVTRFMFFFIKLTDFRGPWLPLALSGPPTTTLGAAFRF